MRFRKSFTLRIALAMAMLVTHCPAAPIYTYKVIAKYPHSTDSYTEGFFYLNGLFYEGIGLNGHSGIVVTQPETGKPLQQFTLPQQYFGEGIIDWGPNLLQWTWQSHVGFVLDRFSLRVIKQFHYDGEGWGITRTANELEYIKGEIYANIWHSDRIARISPTDGHVIAWIDLTGILPDDQKINAESVLNGIAYDAKKDRLFVTGKQWPAVFEIRIVPKSK